MGEHHELTEEEQRVIKRVELFAKRNDLVLFNVKSSLYDRVRTITRDSGKCPCHSDTRPHSPCISAFRGVEIMENALAECLWLRIGKRGGGGG